MRRPGACPGMGRAEEASRSAGQDAELLEGWAEKAGDPEVYVVDWTAGHRACLLICGVYPTVPEEEQKKIDLNAEAEAARTKDNLKNYASVTDNPEEAFIELDR